jgi:hypothetical protein
MIKSSIILQDLRRKIYLKEKTDSAGTGGEGSIKVESAASLIGHITLQMKLTE